MACQGEQRGDHGKESTEPGEAAAEPIEELLRPVNVRKRLHQRMWVLQLVIDLGAEYAGEGGPQDDVVGNVGKPPAARFRPQNEVGSYKGQPHENAEGAQIQGSEMDIGEQRKKVYASRFCAILCGSGGPEG